MDRPAELVQEQPVEQLGGIELIARPNIVLPARDDEAVEMKSNDASTVQRRSRKTSEEVLASPFRPSTVRIRDDSGEIDGLDSSPAKKRDGGQVETELRLVDSVSRLVEFDEFEANGIEMRKDEVVEVTEKLAVLKLERDSKEVEFEGREVGDPVERWLEGDGEVSDGVEVEVEVSSLGEGQVRIDPRGWRGLNRGKKNDLVRRDQEKNEEGREGRASSRKISRRTDVPIDPGTSARCSRRAVRKKRRGNRRRLSRELPE